MKDKAREISSLISKYEGFLELIVAASRRTSVRVEMAYQLLSMDMEGWFADILNYSSVMRS